MYSYSAKTIKKVSKKTSVLEFKVKKLHEDAIIPTKAHESDSGWDLYILDDIEIKPKETVIIPTGIAIKLPPFYEAQVRPRSGVTSKTKLRVQLGTIDNDYTGDVGIIVDNIGDEPIALNSGYKLAQLVVQQLPNTVIEVVDDLEHGIRGDKGFGSSGV